MVAKGSGRGGALTGALRPAHLRDLLAFRSQPLTMVGGPSADLESDCLLSAPALVLALATGLGRHRFFVAALGNQLKAAVHIIADAPAKRWEVVRSTSQATGVGQLAELLGRATHAGGAEDIPRVVARVLEDDPRRVAFEEAGFRPYANETLLVADLTNWEPAPGDAAFTRPCRRSDEYMLQRLYTASAPQGVRQIEPMTPGEFLRPYVGRGSRGVIAEEGSEVAAAAGFLRLGGSQVAVLRLLLRPDTVAAGVAATNRQFLTLREHGVRTVWLPARDYSSDVLAVARQCGFEPVAVRRLLVKQTTALVKQPVFARLREGTVPLPAVNGSRLVHNGSHVPQCRLRGDTRPRRRALPLSAQ